MSVEVGTRIYNEGYFLEAFIRYYLNLGVDKISFFDCGSTDETLEIIREWCKKDARIHLVVSDPRLRFITYSKDEDLCNIVLQYAIKSCRTSGEPCWWIFPDMDEFINPPEEGLPAFLEKYREQRIIRCVFYDWFLAPGQARENMAADQVLEQAVNKELKGRLLYLLNDPFYKDYVLYIDEGLFGDESKCKINIIYGNHRFIINNTLKVPPSTPVLSVNHLRGVSHDVAKSRLEIRLELLRENYDKRNDAQSYGHFRKLRQEIEDYENLYSELKDYDAILTEQDKINRFDSRSSHFNRIISFRYQKAGSRSTAEMEILRGRKIWIKQSCPLYKGKSSTALKE